MKITFPHLGNAYIALEALLQGLGLEPVVPPLGSKRTLELGSSLSPEHTCLPFKIILGNMLQGIEAGADSVLMLGGCGPCRLGYYGEIQRILLEDSGFKGDFFSLEPELAANLKLLRMIFRQGIKRKLLSASGLAWAKLLAVEQLEEQTLRLRPWESSAGAACLFLKEQLVLVRKAQTIRSLHRICAQSEDRFQDLIAPYLQKERLSIGIVGEIYTMLEPFANLNLEIRLGRLGVEVLRTLSLKRWLEDHLFKKLLGYSYLNELKKSARGYLSDFIGGHGLESIAHSVQLSQKEVAGIIHVLPLACMPEVVAQGILPRLGREGKTPIMSLVFDEHSGETGLQTRLEAFVDLVQRRSAAHVLG